MIIRFVSTADAERQNTQSQKIRTMATTLLGRYLTGLCLTLFGPGHHFVREIFDRLPSLIGNHTKVQLGIRSIDVGS